MPENILDRWPLPLLIGEIIGEECDPAVIFACPERRPIERMLRDEMILTPEQHYRYLVAVAQHAALYLKGRDPLATPLQRANLRRLPPLF